MAKEYDPFEGLESNQKVGLLTSGVAGIASGVIKIPKGVFSLAAELIDLGADTKLAVDVEQFFDKINPFEEIAQETGISYLNLINLYLRECMENKRKLSLIESNN